MEGTIGDHLHRRYCIVKLKLDFRWEVLHRWNRRHIATPTRLSPPLLEQGPTKVALESEEDRCMYALGVAVATQANSFKRVRRK